MKPGTYFFAEVSEHCAVRLSGGVLYCRADKEICGGFLGRCLNGDFDIRVMMDRDECGRVFVNHVENHVAGVTMFLAGGLRFDPTDVSAAIDYFKKRMAAPSPGIAR